MARPKGSLNRPKRRLLQLIQESFPDYHPVLEMAKTANDPEVDLKVRFDANREVAKYVEPTLKAIELSGDEDHPLAVKEIPFRSIPVDD